MCQVLERLARYSGKDTIKNYCRIHDGRTLIEAGLGLNKPSLTNQNRLGLLASNYEDTGKPVSVEDQLKCCSPTLRAERSVALSDTSILK